MTLAVPSSAYVARPAAQARGTVLVVHEIFGLTPHIRSVCDRLAEEGYLAIAPDLFAASLQGGFLPYSAEGKTQGLAIKNALGEERMADDVLSLASSAEGRVAVMGFCLGGAIAWMAAADPRVACAIGYYGVGLKRLLDRRPMCPVLMHFGLHDPSIKQAEVDALREAWPQVDVREYDAGHAFNRDDDAAYVPAAAAQAWQRTLSMLQEHLR